jgi:hypothetical protein
MFFNTFTHAIGHVKHRYNKSTKNCKAEIL